MLLFHLGQLMNAIVPFRRIDEYAIIPFKTIDRFILQGVSEGEVPPPFSNNPNQHLGYLMLFFHLAY